MQRVARQDGSSSDDFRGYQGRLEAGRLNVGDEVRILPNNKTARIAEIHAPGGKTDSARAGEVLTVTLDSDIDISRGDCIVSSDNPIAPQHNFQAALCWFDEIPLNLRRKYLLKQGSRTTAVKISEISYIWDIHTLSHVQSAQQLNLNDIGNVVLKTQQPLNATAYTENPATGAFILIDEATNHTVAAGMIRGTNQESTFEI